MSLLILIVQIAVILLVARIVGWLFRAIQQPQVVGEMVAGILLGPSLLGWVAPDISARLFPPESLGYLNSLSQVGLLVFMFLVGLEFNPRLIRGRGQAAIVISHVSIVTPFVLGSLLALYLYPRLSESDVSFTGFALFMGAAMSVTAFPVLARILTERNLLRSRVGTVAIACSAVDDVTAWTILAVVIAIVRADAVEVPLWLTMAGTMAYIAVMVFVVRRALRWLESFYHNRGQLTQDMVAIVLFLLLASAWTTEWLGIHALFGAFALGTVMPKEQGFVHDVTKRLEDLTVVLLLPLFFALTGLRTSIGLVTGGEMLIYAGLILLVAVTGKFGGSTLAARIMGMRWREAGAVGILMNTRGLMELVILSIGHDLGVISPAVYTMMVFMALITTFMTTPILEWLYPARLFREQSVAEAAVDEEREFTVLLPVSLPASGPGLLEAAAALAPAGRKPRFFALHLERTSDGSLTRVDPGRIPSRDEVLLPLLSRAKERNLTARPLSFLTHDVSRDLLSEAYTRGADLVLMGWHKPIVGRSILSGTVGEVLRRGPGDVAVFVQRDAEPWRRVLALFINPETDGTVLELARRIATNTGAVVTVLQVLSSEEEAPVARPAAGMEGLLWETVVSETPLETIVNQAVEGDYNLTIVSTNRLRETEPSRFGLHSDEFARALPANLLVVRSGGALAAGRVTREARASA
ncbi:MAG: cation:proton antiporter [Gemmatimonadota bacterium]|jgi:Kef-type K+ transport system membrane component KefB/nucleotide-binding universal stress UspA family protein|nr:cation:proton antiporter [Gemmatimonadota bacterium]